MPPPGLRAAALLASALLAAAASPAAGVLCGGGAACPDVPAPGGRATRQTCVSHAPSAGHRFACAPAPDATICPDARFSCPRGLACDPRNGTCGGAAATDPGSGPGPRAGMLVNGPAVPTGLGAPRADSFCNIVRPGLPAFCNCTDKHLGGTVGCYSKLLGDQIGLVADFDPCGQTAHADINVVDKKFGVNYTVAGIEEGLMEDIPIPGLSLIVPVIGSAGANLAFGMRGDLDELTIKLGLDACIQVGGAAGKKVCGSNIKISKNPLPWWILNGTYHFTNICWGEAQSTLVV